MSAIEITVAPHPLLLARGFITSFATALSQLPSPPWLLKLLSLDAAAPLRSDDQVRSEIRDLLRHGGYKPTGRGKPAAEYLIKAASEGSLGSINVAVDVCNAVSLHSGLPISVIDLDRAQPPLRIAVGEPGQSYVFNAAGQSIELQGLLYLGDAGGPCANAVKDAQRTKTHEGTTRTLSIVWGTKSQGERTAQAYAWYRDLLDRVGAATQEVL
jgi:DNA/RNA-binding domain of Phe-tRNA-synthetase-like protein